MSFDVFLQKFEGGSAASADADVVLEVLGPFLVTSDEGWAQVRTVDGEAEVYGMGDVANGLMFTHASGDAVWDLMYGLASKAGFAVMPVGCPTCLTTIELRSELPSELQRTTAVVHSGDELRDVVERS